MCWRGLYCPPLIPAGIRPESEDSGNSGGIRFGTGTSQIKNSIPAEYPMESAYSRNADRNAIPGIDRNGIRRNVNNNLSKLGNCPYWVTRFKRRHVTSFFPPPALSSPPPPSSLPSSLSTPLANAHAWAKSPSNANPSGASHRMPGKSTQLTSSPRLTHRPRLPRHGPQQHYHLVDAG